MTIDQRHPALTDRLLLASASPRRREILAALGFDFDVAIADVDESPLLGEAPRELATRLAAAKASAIASANPDRLALGSDTVVAFESTALGKPSSVDEATAVLRALRGREHQVITAVAAARTQGGHLDIWQACDVTRVWMRDYTDDEIAAYIESGDPFDKAGSYAIQHPIFRPVARIEGCYLAVVGLGLPALRTVLADTGVISASIWSATSRHVVCQGCKWGPCNPAD